MLNQKNLSLVLILDIFQTETVHLFPQIIQNLHQPHVPGTIINYIMVSLVRLGNLHGISIVNGVLECLSRPLHFHEIGIRHPLAGQLDSQFLQGTPYL